MTRSVCVVIPTMAERSRRDSLRRAIDSACTQSDVAAKVVVVVNGARWDGATLEELARLPLTVVRLEEGNLPSALYRGRLAVEEDYFSFLDDDDCYLPGTLAARVTAVEERRSDFAVSNGMISAGTPLISDLATVSADPLGALVARNWLTSCGGLYRTATISPNFFLDLTKYFEWTDLALRLLSAKMRVTFVGGIGFQLADTEGSASKQSNIESVMNGLAIVEQMAAVIGSRNTIQLRSKLASAHHAVSDHCLQSGQLGEAWRMHLRSLRLGGWQYLLYTRHLMRGVRDHRTSE